ncbi:MAG TPA: hypothetical protein VKT30_00015 [Caulobacteraceae bacterium]|nr:hypothetical protein [Caulobacteraceae bacterium]
MTEAVLKRPNGVARAVALQYLGWPRVGPAAIDRIKLAFDPQIDQLG